MRGSVIHVYFSATECRVMTRARRRQRGCDLIEMEIDCVECSD